MALQKQVLLTSNFAKNTKYKKYAHLFIFILFLTTNIVTLVKSSRESRKGRRRKTSDVTACKKAQKEVKTLHSMAASPKRTKEKEQNKNEFKWLISL